MKKIGKIIALDYGKKRIGIAETDDKQIIATGLTTISTEKIFNFLNIFFYKNYVQTIVVGMPKTLSGQLNLIELDILFFLKQFKKKFPQISIKRIDERFTSKIASQSLSLIGISTKKKELVDKISAVLILQSYLTIRDKKINIIN